MCFISVQCEALLRFAVISGGTSSSPLLTGGGVQTERSGAEETLCGKQLCHYTAFQRLDKIILIGVHCSFISKSWYYLATVGCNSLPVIELALWHSEANQKRVSWDRQKTPCCGWPPQRSSKDVKLYWDGFWYLRRPKYLLMDIKTSNNTL